MRALGLCAAALVLAAGPAYADHGGDVDCENFQTQPQAQAHYNAHPGDPDNLDADNDGRACESLPGGSGGGAPGVPVGGVDAGAGGMAGDRSGVLLILSGVVLGAGGSVVVRRARRA